MGLLAPIYLAGLVAIGLPILFHLIRRTPRGRQVFSSLMFLSTSPPRVTRRSRLTNILLLILRAAAFTVLAIAFARPFFNRGADLTAVQSAGRRVALLVDTSASMRRADLWQQARQKVDEVLNDVSAADEVSLQFFDRQVRPGMTFGEWNETDPARRVAVLRGRLAAAGPSWESTKLGDALATVAGLLGETEGTSRSADKTVRQVVLISDLQQGGRVESLQGHEWPKNVLLQVKPVAPKQAGNASLLWVKQTAGDGEKADGRLRVRVSNQPDSKSEQFALAWANSGGVVAGIAPIKVYVAPGRSQIVRVPWPAQSQKVDRLVLSGDDCDFDNTLYVVSPRVESLRVLYVGDDVADDPKGLLYYLSSALADTPERKVELLARPGGQLLADADLLGARLAVIASALSEGPAGKVRRFVEGGGAAIWVLKDVATSAGRVAGFEKMEAQEATGDFSLIGRVEYGHPLFAPFAESRFGDFTRIHFWKHRRVKVAEEAGVRVLVKFDNGDPFLLERTMGKGRVWVFTSGWHPADSQLALSTKFVPLIDGMARRPDESPMESWYAVHDSIALPPALVGRRTLIAPDGKRVELASAATTTEATEQPGIYQLDNNGQETPLAVNLSADESRTAPLAVEDLERWGARLGDSPKPDELVSRQRRLRTIELENRQKAWRWLIIGVLALLAAETALAGRLARRDINEQVTT